MFPYDNPFLKKSCYSENANGIILMVNLTKMFLIRCFTTFFWLLKQTDVNGAAGIFVF